MKKIGIIGNGVVGSTLTKYLLERTSFEPIIHDPHQDKFGNIDECDYAFVAIPIPKKSFEQILEPLVETLKLFPNVKGFFIRSTVNPTTCDYLTDVIGRPCFSFPEFLTERTSYDDFLQNKTILGLPDIDDANHVVKFVKELISSKPNNELVVMRNSEAEMVKLAHNVFGATKVTYFNVINELCRRDGIDYQTVKRNIGITGFINDMHTNVPGPDGKFGWGGKCFPDNVVSMIGYCGQNMAHDFFAGIYKLNEYHRREK